jgi:hypothetical protein
MIWPLFPNLWDDNELLQFCLDDDVRFNDIASAIFDYVAEEQIGIYIAEEWYDQNL